MRKKSSHRAILPATVASLLAAFMLSACGITPKPLTAQELVEKAASDRDAMFNQGVAITHPLTLSEAIARTLRFNLDKRSKMMEEALALGQLDVSRYDLLPRLVAEGGYVGRTDHATTSSTNSQTGQPALGFPYYSLDENRAVGDLTLSWNVLDFGVSWYTAHQNADRSLIAAERRRKATAALVQEVRLAYWRAASSQKLNSVVQASIAAAEKAMNDAHKVENEDLRNPLDSLRFQKALLDNLRQLEAIQLELATAKASLTALINVPYTQDYSLAVPDPKQMSIATWSMPIEQMEDIAFVNNPELREEIYQSRIVALETRKTIIKLLPGISFAGGGQYDSNSFLQHNIWGQASAQLSMNIMNLFSAPTQIKYAETNESLAEARRLALRMAVLAQIHISRIQYESAVQQYKRADQAYSIERRLAQTTASRQENDAQSILDRVSSETAAIAAELRFYDTYAQSQSALGRMEAAMGVELIPATVNTTNLDDLSAAVSSRLATLDRGIIPTDPDMAPAVAK
jgi:outer membrane protein TolC